MKNLPPQIAIVWRGDREARRAATPQNNRFHRIFEELAAVGLTPEPAVFDEEFADEVLACDARRRDSDVKRQASLWTWSKPIDRHPPATSAALGAFRRLRSPGPATARQVCA
ncbi:hypothetical protein ELH18_08405 [Rhizobium ruizarguesonis]|nr:hypothetical protein ELH60_08570 [Rhizobium ruizarguesonis]TBC62837.1 hypothetical protein ELH36_08580 [Rhizobium ruizarguesonis]TBD37480.1 hypothetical protein ELH18_08405 [Rhizobium ruizarguesonis]